MTVNTHELYNTIEHEHIGNGEIELNLVGCADGRWFVENYWNDKHFLAIAELSNPGIEPYIPPIQKLIRPPLVHMNSSQYGGYFWLLIYLHLNQCGFSLV